MHATSNCMASSFSSRVPWVGKRSIHSAIVYIRRNPSLATYVCNSIQKMENRGCIPTDHVARRILSFNTSDEFVLACTFD